MTDQTTLLTDIFHRLGTMEGQNRLILEEQGRAAKGRKDIYKLHEENMVALARLDAGLANVVGHVDEMKPKVETAAAVAATVKTHHDDIEDLKGFKVKLAVAALLVSGVVTGAINLIALAIANSGQIKDAFKTLLLK